jgi:hypothetical protein
MSRRTCPRYQLAVPAAVPDRAAASGAANRKACPRAQTRLTSSAFGPIGVLDGAAQCNAPFRPISLPMRQDQTRVVLPPDGVLGLRTIGGLTVYAVARKEARSCVSESVMASDIAIQSCKPPLRSRVRRRRACSFPRMLSEQTRIVLAERVHNDAQCVNVAHSIPIQIAAGQ